jgi:hypothetical protein
MSHQSIHLIYIYIIAPILTKWFNLQSKTAHFPEEWKTAIIVPIFKNKGSAQEIANYRPIALTSCMRRVYERCVLKEMAKFDDTLSKVQGGFRRKCSTYNQVIALQEFCKNHPKAIHAFLDIKAAYDCVDRRLLWKRIEKLDGMSRPLIRILQGLFDHNVSRLVFHGKLSDPIPNQTGLLKGSSLLPILFNQFINDLLMKLNELPTVHSLPTDNPQMPISSPMMEHSMQHHCLSCKLFSMSVTHESRKWNCLCSKEMCYPGQFS